MLFSESEVNVALKAVNNRIDAISCLDTNLLMDNRVFSQLLNMVKNNKILKDTDILTFETKEEFLSKLDKFAESLPQEQRTNFFKKNEYSRRIEIA